MTRTVWIVLAVLCAWGFVTVVRRMRDEEQSGKLPDGEGGSGYQKTGLKDDIDWDELQKAEDEVRDVDPMANPEQGFEGDDWGPGAAPRPPVA